MPKISKGAGPSYRGYLDPEPVEDQAEIEREAAEREATGEGRRKVGGKLDSSERIERTGGPEELEGDGTGTALPPAADDPETEERPDAGPTDPERPGLVATDGGHVPPPARKTKIK